MGDQYDQMPKEDQGFVPGLPVVSNPYSILPQDVGNLSSVNLLEDRLSVPISNLFYGCYELVMQIDDAHRGNRGATGLAGQRFHGSEDGCNWAFGSSVSASPKCQSNTGMNAGPSFRFTRGGTAVPHQTPTWKLFVERMNEMSVYCGILVMRGSSIPALAGVTASLARYAKQISDALK